MSFLELCENGVLLWSNPVGALTFRKFTTSPYSARDLFDHGDHIRRASGWLSSRPQWTIQESLML
jgi:hypothetical protein